MRAESRDDEHAATAPSAPEARLAPASGCSVAVSVHDSTRLEWIATIPLRPERAERYRLEVLLAFPSQDFTPRTPWKRLQSSARFDVPQRAQAGPIADLHSLRLHTLEVTRLLARAAEGFRRHCVDLRLGQVDPRLDTTTTLAIWLRNAVGTLALSHDRVRTQTVGEPEALLRERALAAEYLSVEGLWAFTVMAQALDDVAREVTDATVQTAVTQVRGELATAISGEVAWRTGGGLVEPRPDPAALEAYLFRASQLKKHFEGVLYLDRETRDVDSRVQPWIAALATAAAGATAFLIQAAILRLPIVTSAGISSGVILLALAGGALYAARERFKEIGRAWLKSGVERFLAQRAIRFFATAPNGHRRLVAHGRESFETTTTLEPDPLNPLLGATSPRTALRFVHEGRTDTAPRGEPWPADRVRLLFRFDFSPIFPRLHDPLKPIAVVDLEGRVQVVDAPRVYRLPVKVWLHSGGSHEEHTLTLTVNKLGLHRLDATRE